MDSYEKLVESLEKEHQAFKDSYKSMSTTQVYNDWYIIAFYESYYDMLTLDLVQNVLDDSVLEWLAEKEKPLEFLYDKWMSCDGSLSLDWDDMAEWIVLVYKEEKFAKLYAEQTKSAVPNDKIMVALLDAGYYEERQEYPAEYSSEYAHEVYTFDTPEEFVQKWYDLPEGDWYWVFDKGEIVCSGALDPNDIEIFEDYWDKSFEDLYEDVDLPEKVIITAKTLALDTDDIYADKEEIAEIISDYLSDTYGYCHRGFNCEVLYNEFGEPSEVVVTDIDWDIDVEDSCSLDKKIENARSMVQEPSDGEQLDPTPRFENTI